MATAQAPKPIDIPETIGRLPEAVGTDLAKVGLAATVRAIYAYRRQARPMGYEGTPEWDQNFSRVFDAFEARLWSGELPDLAKRVAGNRGLIQQFTKAYGAQREKFLEFRSRFAEVRSMPLYLRKSPPDLTERAQLYFAAILAGAPAGELDRATSITAIWPFCG